MPLAVDAPGRRRLPILLRRAWFGLNQAFRRRLAPLGLTPDRFTVMRTLLENTGVTQRELTRLMASDPNTVAALLARMEAEGWIERRPSARDRRANTLRLTSAGRRRYQAARRVAIALQEQVLHGLGENRREDFLSNLETLAQACQQATQGVPRARPGWKGRD
jgi:DNA-binding MarR family transcriptional regulator